MILRDSGKRIFSNDTVSTENHLSKISLTQEAPCAITPAASISLKMRFYGSHSTKGQNYPLLFPRPRLMMLTNCSSESFCISNQFPKKSFSEKKVFGRGGQTFFGISILPSDLRNFPMTAEIAVNHHPYSLPPHPSSLRLSSKARRTIIRGRVTFAMPLAGSQIQQDPNIFLDEDDVARGPFSPLVPPQPPPLSPARFWGGSGRFSGARRAQPPH